VFTDLEIIFEYTNISFTEKQKEDLPKLYDTICRSGLLEAIIAAIPEEEYNTVIVGIVDSTEAIYKYQNSVLGIIDTLKGDMQDIENIDVEGMKKSLVEIANSPLMKEIVPLLGLEEPI
jgi:hypothetical protein